MTEKIKVIADKGYDSDALVATIEAVGGEGMHNDGADAIQPAISSVLKNEQPDDLMG